nr:uncharacterized protein FLJ37310-like [Vicugna pacos]
MPQSGGQSEQEHPQGRRGLTPQALHPRAETERQGSAAAAASLIRARSPASPRRAVSCSLARGTGAPKCGRDSAPPPPLPLARRRSRSRRGHLGNGDRPAPGYGGRRGTSLRGRRRARERTRGEGPGWEGWRRGDPGAAEGASRGSGALPRGPGPRRRRVASLAGNVR